jgi:putative ABC transport system permease protein
VLALVVGSGMRMVLAGIIVGLVASLASSRLMASLLYRVGTTDPLTFAVVTTAIGVVALAASVIPAWRAMRLDPMANLRSG